MNINNLDKSNVSKKNDSLKINPLWKTKKKKRKTVSNWRFSLLDKNIYSYFVLYSAFWLNKFYSQFRKIIDFN